ncbi:alpha/beta fold hydrolase [Dactylosporangium siamense]|uniref:Alpha/beta hydrolase n=1 Tax=Dactylosporangium siamense TaxID=685454 RepID=A0A919UFK1_9ACTN|nr:alpha/beta fold hydrolase [Dactylosporangium siamense]GIG48748.1 alpha/beta hydrolase [Dactylosporangium siamense]
MGTGHIEVSDGSLYYEAVGDGPAVVLLHGGLLDCRMWDDQFELLAATHRVIRLDVRSHGRSSTATGDFRHDDDLAAVLDTLGVDRVALVGLSMGGRIAFDFAVSRPQRVWALCAAATGISGMTFTDPYVLDRYQEMGRAAQERDTAAFVEAFLRAWVDGPHRRPEDVAASVRVRCADMAANNATRHATAQGRMLERDALHRLGEVTAPTLLVIGDTDSSDIVDVTQRAVRDVPGARRVEIPGAGHMINLEQPDAFNTVLLPFLQEQSP